MRISELIKQLEDLKTKHGDMMVVVESLSHVWDPEPMIKHTTSKVDGSRIPIYVCLNP